MRALAAVLVAAGVSWSPPHQTFRSGTQVVTLTVSAKQGNVPVAGLLASDFEVRDNGVRQDTELLPPATVPLDVTMVISPDSIRLSRAKLEPDIKNLVSWLQPQDRVRVISNGRTVSEPISLRPASEIPQGDWIGDLWFAREHIDHEHDPRLFGSTVWEGLLLALMRPVEVGRRSVIVSFWFSGASGSAVNDGALVVGVAAKSDHLLYVVHSAETTEPLPSDSTLLQYLRESLADAAKATGGDLRQTGRGVSSLRTGLDELRTSYVLRYTLTGVPAAGWHTLSVAVRSRPGVIIQTRQGYLGR